MTGFTDRTKLSMAERALLDADNALREPSDEGLRATADRSVRLALHAFGWSRVTDMSPDELQEALATAGMRARFDPQAN